MKPWGTPAWTGCSCEDFPLLMTFYSKPCITKKKRNTSKYLSWNSIRLKFVKRTSMSDPVKSLRYITCYNSTSPDLLKATAILSDTTVRRSAVDQEDLKQYGNKKKSHNSLDDQQSYYLQVFQRLQ